MSMSSPAAALVCKCNGAICPHAPPSAAAFLDSTTARGPGQPPLVAAAPPPPRRISPAPTRTLDSFSSGTGSEAPTIHSLVNPSVRVAIREMRARLPAVIEDEDLELTALVRGAGSCSSGHHGLFAESGARLAVAGRGRDAAAAAKYAHGSGHQRNW